MNPAITWDGLFVKAQSNDGWGNGPGAPLLEAERGETMVTKSLQLLLFSIFLFPQNLGKLSRNEIMLFISSNQRQKIYVHGVKGLVLISHGFPLHGVLHVKFWFSVSWWKFMQPQLDCSSFFFFFLKISFPDSLLGAEQRRSAGGEINFSARRE